MKKYYERFPLDTYYMPKYGLVEPKKDSYIKFMEPKTFPREKVFKEPLCLKYDCSAEIRKKIRIAKKDKDKSRLLEAE